MSNSTDVSFKLCESFDYLQKEFVGCCGSWGIWGICGSWGDSGLIEVRLLVLVLRS